MRIAGLSSRAARIVVVPVTALAVVMGTASCVDAEQDDDDEVQQEEESDEDD